MCTYSQFTSSEMEWIERERERERETEKIRQRQQTCCVVPVSGTNKGHLCHFID
jgi:hypothetical protein